MRLDFTETSKIKVSGAQSIHGPAFFSAGLELKTLEDHPLRETLERINDLYSRWYINELMKVENSSRHLPPTHNLRRLSVLREPGNKTRLITLGDLWSQNALLPLHEDIMNKLSHLKEDCTFTASEQVGALVKLTKHKSVHCFDLKEFTNMLPLSLQVAVLTHLNGGDSSFPKDWARIMREPLLYEGKEISFSRGQPMGLLSSWAVATLTHHALIRWA